MDRYKYLKELVIAKAWLMIHEEKQYQDCLDVINFQEEAIQHLNKQLREKDDYKKENDILKERLEKAKIEYKKLKEINKFYTSVD